MKKLQHELEEKFEDLKTTKKKNKRNFNLSEDSSEDSEEPEENALSAILKSVGNFKFDNGAQVFIDPKHPNVAFVGTVGNQGNNYNDHFNR